MDLMTASYYVSKTRGPIIRLFARDKSRERKVIEVSNFKPYFYVPYSEAEKPGEMVFDVFDRPVTKVFVPTPGDVTHARRGYTFTDEANVRFEWRYLIDQGIFDAFTKNEQDKLVPSESLHIPLRIGYSDIEVSSPVIIIPKPKNPDYPVVTFQVKDSYTGKKVVLILSNEKRLTDGTVFEYRSKKVIVVSKIEDMITLFEQYDCFVVYMSSERELLFTIPVICSFFGFDVLTGWWWNQYDMPYLYFRSQKLGVRLPFYVKPHPQKKNRWVVRTQSFESVDLLELYQIKTKPKGQKLSNDLKFICQEESHEQFVYTDIGDAIEYHWNYNHMALIKYTFDEVEALEIVDIKREVIKYFDGVRRKNGCPLSEAHTRNKVVRYLLFRESRKPIPTNTYDEMLEQDVVKGLLPKEPKKKDLTLKGATVDEPEVGFHEYVVDVDIRGMYPVIMQCLNISKEMKSKDGTLVAADGTRFKKSPKGLLSRIIEKLMQEKDRIDAMLFTLDTASVEFDYLSTERETTKYTLNAIYGVQKWKFFELYDIDCARAVTATGRDIKASLQKYIISLSYIVVYGDTDSVHVKVASLEEALLLLNKLKDFLKNLCIERGYLTTIEIDIDKFFRRVLYVTKKRYVGLCTYYKNKPTNELMMFGIAAKRSDSALLTIKLQKAFLDVVVKEGKVEEGFNLIRDAVKNFDSYPLSQIGVPKGLQKAEYKNFAWKNGCVWSTKYLGLRFREDQKPRLIYGTVVLGGDMQWKAERTKYFCIRGEEDDHFKPKVRLNKQKMLEVTIFKKFEDMLDVLGFSLSDIWHYTKKTELTQFC